MERFDERIDREHTGSLKYDGHAMFRMPDDLLPMWVADMDFRVPEAVTQRLKELADFGIFGYTMITDEYFEAVKGWFSSRFGWEVRREWLLQTPGVVFALANAVRAFTKPGEGVVIQQPVYYPFGNVIGNNGREIVNSPLRYEEGRYAMDFADLEKKLSRPDVTMMILCSPHNPVGRVWTRAELERAATLCIDHGVRLVCDEIHCDFVYGENVHTPVGSLSEEILANTCICTAPSKTFNLAGLQISNIFIADRQMRRAYKKELDRTGFGWANMFGMAACQAAYEKGADWVDEMVAYIGGNIEYMRDFVSREMPRIRLCDTEGTYLVWMDLTGLELSKEKQYDFIVNKAKLWLDTGDMFGESGAGFERINAACPRSTIEECMRRLKAAYDGLER